MLLRGMGSSSSTQQDQYLQEPPVVSPGPTAVEGYQGQYPGDGYDYPDDSYLYPEASGTDQYPVPDYAESGAGYNVDYFDAEADYYYPSSSGPEMGPDSRLGPASASARSATGQRARRPAPGRGATSEFNSQPGATARPLPSATHPAFPATGAPGIANGRQLQQPIHRSAGQMRRAVQRARPFGYELFRGVPNTFAPATDIPVPADYTIGPGDNIRVQLFGNQNETFTLLVSRDGTVNFPKLGPIVVTGLSFDELQAMLEDRVSKEMIGTTASVTLGRLRSMRVFVLGDVNRPGSYTVSSLSTMTHALFVSGGITPIGSLRRVQLKRAGEVVRTLDLYRFLLSGDSSNDARLQPGDVVFVPPAGTRVTVEGEVKRPAIYELDSERSVADVMALAGGRLASSDQTYVQVERVSAGAKRSVLDLDLADASDLAAPVLDGDVIRLRRVARQIANEIRVAGYVKHPGVYPWAPEQDLRTVLQQAGVMTSDADTEVYLPLGAIERTNSQTGIREFISFNVATSAAEDGPSIALQPNDLVIVFGRDDIGFLSSYDVQAVLDGGASALRDCPAITELRAIANSQRAVRFLKTLASENVRLENTQRLRSRCPAIFRDVPRALPFLLDKGVGVYGEVVRPGLYPVSDGTSVQLLLQAAGGTTAESDPKNVEYVSYLDALAHGRSRYQLMNLSLPETAGRTVAAGDILNLRPIYLDQEVGSVRLMGEVRFPGTYGIVRGETLSQVMQRAGGLTDIAYPYGAVFTRERAREAEQASFQRAARDLQETVVTVVTSGVLRSETASTAQFMEGAIRRLNDTEAVGRVVIQADPVVLKVRPELDPVLEPGDALFIPKRPNSVAVVGQVLSQGSLAFTPNASALYYIEQAGGFGQAADKKRVFVVLPDGSARKLQLSSWNFEKHDIPPGSSIVVPRDAAPLNALVLSERVISIFADLALSAAALVTVTNDD